MTDSTRFFGVLSSVASDYLTYDNQSIITVLREINQDMEYYQEANNKFFAPLTETIETPTKVVKYFQSNVQDYVEGARPQGGLSEFDFVQEVGFNEKQDALTLTTRAIQMMSAEQVASYVQAKLTGFQASRYSELRKCIFTNTNRTQIDTTGKYQTVSKPFYNSDTDTLAPPVPGITFQAGNLQHYNGTAGASLAASDIRTSLIDKVRRHGFRNLEIWVSDFDYSIEGLAEFVPAEGQVGRNLDVESGSNPGTRGQMLSSWEGFVGTIFNVPVIKTRIVPVGYAVCVGTDGGATMTPFLSRLHPVPGLRGGLTTEIQNPQYPLQNTIMVDGWGYAPNHRGAVAVLQMNAQTYSIPSNL